MSSRLGLGTRPPSPGSEPSSWSLQSQARHGAASPPGVWRTRAMENVEHAGPGVLVLPSLGRPRMEGEDPAWTKPPGTWIQMTHPP